MWLLIIRWSPAALISRVPTGPATPGMASNPKRVNGGAFERRTVDPRGCPIHASASSMRRRRDGASRLEL
jgi:hypothetical protein